MIIWSYTLERVCLFKRNNFQQVEVTENVSQIYKVCVCVCAFICACTCVGSMHGCVYACMLACLHAYVCFVQPKSFPENVLSICRNAGSLVVIIGCRVWGCRKLVGWFILWWLLLSPICVFVINLGSTSLKELTLKFVPNFEKLVQHCMICK